MNFERRAKEPNCVCTCSDLYKVDIASSIELGCEDAEEIMYDQSTQFRCGLCRPSIESMITKARE
jgi:NAD(P)H-nitrite reductase large subunit